MKIDYQIPTLKGAFKETLSSYFPDTIVLIENRSGTRYSVGKFIISTIEQLLNLSRVIDNRESSLRITLDILQLFTVHQVCRSKKDFQKQIKHRIFINLRKLLLWRNQITE